MNNPDSSRNSRHNAIACDRCQGVTEHEPWCVTQDPRVCYAYEIVTHASKLTFIDTLILHSLGVTWSDAQV